MSGHSLSPPGSDGVTPARRFAGQWPQSRPKILVCCGSENAYQPASIVGGTYQRGRDRSWPVRKCGTVEMRHQRSAELPAGDRSEPAGRHHLRRRNLGPRRQLRSNLSIDHAIILRPTFQCSGKIPINRCEVGWMHQLHKADITPFCKAAMNAPILVQSRVASSTGTPISRSFE